MRSVSSVAAVIHLLITTAAVTFQIALALGAPWGEYAMGGRFPGRFPAAMRVAALVQALLLSAMALIVLTRAGLVLPLWAQASILLTWGVVAVSVVSVVLNSITPSRRERRLWLPVASALLASSLVVALFRD